ncbi:hypothetical protein KKI17_00730 [Patescibacteria group bacterium]|nr:hypothetical protein [Patescibacteria group bacterium]
MKYILVLPLLLFLCLSPIQAQEALEVPDTLQESRGFLEKITKGLPQALVNIWNKTFLPTLQKVWDFLFSPVLNWLGNIIEERKDTAEEEFEKEKEQLKDSAKEELQDAGQSLWERFKELFAGNADDEE